MKRLQDFRSRISKTIRNYEGKDFEIGERDCCLFAADIIEAQTGQDYAQAYRGKYKTIKSGLKLWAKDGYNNQKDFLEKTFEQIERSFVRIGDIALIETNQFNGIGYSVGVCSGQFIIAIGETGLVRIPIEQGKTFYRVGIKNEG